MPIEKKTITTKREENISAFVNAFSTDLTLEQRQSRFSEYTNCCRFGVPGKSMASCIQGLILETKSMIDMFPSNANICENTWSYLFTSGRMSFREHIADIIALLWYFEQQYKKKPLPPFVTIAILSNVDHDLAWQEHWIEKQEQWLQCMKAQHMDPDYQQIGPYDLFLTLQLAYTLDSTTLLEHLEGIANAWIKTLHTGSLLQHLPQPQRDELWDALIQKYPFPWSREECLPDANTIRRSERSYQAWWRYTDEITASPKMNAFHHWVQTWNNSILQSIELPAC